MNTKSWIVAIALVGGMIAARVTWKNLEVKRAAERSISALSSEIVREHSKIHRVEEQLAQSEQERADLQAALAALRSDKRVATAAKAPPAATPASKTPDVLKLLQTDPELQVRQLAAERARLTARYGLLYRLLNLSAEQIAKFEESAIRHKEQQMDLFAVMQSQKITDTAADPVTNKLYQQEETTYAAAQTELLGAEGHRQLQEYERTTVVRDIVSGLAGAATLAGEPFTRQQAEQLTQMLANASSSYAKGNWADPSAIDWAAVDANARTIFSESQANLIKTVEPNGPGGVGARYLVRMNHLISEARKVDAANAPSASKLHP